MSTWTEPLTRSDAAAAVANRLGCTTAEAMSMVDSYVIETGQRVGTSVALWPLDEGDVEAITSSSPATTATAAAVAEATAAVVAAQGRTGDAATSFVSDSADAIYVGQSRGEQDRDDHVEVDAG